MSGYLILQISSDQQSLYVGYCQVNKERKFSYFVDKLALSVSKREHLATLVQDLAQLKIQLMKTPVTIEEDMKALEQVAETELQSIINRVEEFFGPVADKLRELIHPEPKVETEVDAAVMTSPVKGGAAAKKEDPKGK